MLAVTAYSLTAWLMVFGLLGWCDRLFRTENRLVAYLVGAAYWMYLVQIFIVGYIQQQVIGLPVSQLSKFLIVIASSVAVLLLSYEFCVRKWRPS